MPEWPNTPAGPRMLTLGVDLAAATKKTAAAVVEWNNGTARLAHLALGVDDDEIVRLFGASDMTGIDCPVGWPDAFLPFIAGHLSGEAHPVLDYDGIEGRRLLAYRDPDRLADRAGRGPRRDPAPRRRARPARPDRGLDPSAHRRPARAHRALAGRRSRGPLPGPDGADGPGAAIRS
jgi:hypothetical protein